MRPRWLRWWVEASIWGFGIIVLFWILKGAAPLAQCISETSGQAAQRGNTAVNVFIRSYVICLVRAFGYTRDAIIAVGTVFLALYTARLWRATVDLGAEARNASDEQGERIEREFFAEHRPWVSAEVAPGSGLLFIRDDECYMTLELVLTNTGRTPALRLRPYAGLSFYRDEGEDDPSVMQRRFAEGLRLGEGANLPGLTLFPGQKLTRRARVEVPSVNLAKWHEWANTHKLHERPESKLMLIGFLDYQSPLDEYRHQTGFIYEIHQTKPGHGDKLWPIDPTLSKDVPKEHVVLSPSRFGSGVTD